MLAQAIELKRNEEVLLQKVAAWEKSKWEETDNIAAKHFLDITVHEVLAPTPVELVTSHTALSYELVLFCILSFF